MNTNSSLQFVMIPKMTTDPFFHSSALGCKSRSEELGNNLVECQFIGTLSPDATEQAKIIKELITDPTKHNLVKPPDGIVISVIDENITGEAIHYAHASGIPVITFDSDAPQSKRQAFIGTENYWFGIELGRVLDKLNPEGSYYGMITGAGPNLQLRVDGVRKVLQGDLLQPTNWKEVDYSPFDCEMNTTLAIEQMYRFAADPNIKAIIPVGGWPMYDETLWREFIETTKSKSITTVVGDTTTQQIDLMKRDYVNGLVGQMPYQMGNFSVDELLRIVKLKEIKSEETLHNTKIINTPLVGMTRLPNSLPPLIVNYNYIGKFAIFGYVTFSIVALSSIGVAIWVWFNRKNKVVRSSQPVFLFQICVGTFILGSSILPLTVDDHNGNQKAASIACMIFPWLFYIGFTTAFASLFSKTIRINRIMRKALKFKRIQVRKRDILAPYIILMTINIVTLLCWTFVSPSKSMRLPYPGTDDWNRTISCYGTCSTEGEWPFNLILLSVSGIALIIANICAFRGRKIETEYAESKFIAFIVSSVLQLSIVGIPVTWFISDNPLPYFIVRVSLIFLLCMDILCFIFVPKIVAIISSNKKKILEENKKCYQNRHNTTIHDQTGKGLRFSVRHFSPFDSRESKDSKLQMVVEDLTKCERDMLTNFLLHVTKGSVEERRIVMEERLSN